MSARGRSRAALLSDEQGAILLIGLLMAVFLAGLMYSLVGIGDAIVQRERMQDAADAAALSGAVLHARGMNTLVLINMVMAALLAILVALKLVEAIIGVAMTVCYAIAIFNPPAVGLAETLREVRGEVAAAHDELQPQLHAVIRTLHGVARGVRVVVPWTAQTRAIQLVREHYGPPAQAGFLLPMNLALPTQDGTFPELCDRAGDVVGDLAGLPFRSIGLDDVSKVIDGAVDDLAGAGARWFCGSEGAPAPRSTQRYARGEPMLAARQACLERGPNDPGFSNAESARLCALADSDEAASAPDEVTGECVERCERGAPYAERVALARLACDPAAGHDLRAFQWQQRRVTRTWVLDRSGWQLVTEDVDTPRLIRRSKDDRTHPCGRGGSVDGHYDPSPWLDDTGMEPRVVCSNHQRPPTGGARGQRFVDEATEVTHILGCTRHVTEVIEVDSVAFDPGGASTGDAGELVPQRLSEDLRLGDEAFQVRAAVMGALPSAAAAHTVEAAGWRNAPDVQTDADTSAPTSLQSAARRLGQLSLAQAEYFYAVQDPMRPNPASWLWNMRWQARFRRVTSPTDAPDRSAATDAEAFGLEPSAVTAVEACRLASEGAEAEALCPLADDLERGLLEEVAKWIVH